METSFAITTLGECKIHSPLPFSREKTYPFVPETERIEVDAPGEKEKHLLKFEKAGPREQIYFDPSKTRVGIVTCGGLCPGINNVIRTIVMQMSHNYRVKHILGVQYGFQGFIARYGHDIKKLTPDTIPDIHYLGGSILSSSRGSQDIGEIVDCLERQNMNILFCVGGDGTLKGAHAIHEEIQRRQLKIGVIGLPKTIDNDILYCDKTFGFETAFATAVDSVRAAHVEALGAPNGIVIVKLMGRDSGFIAANTALACPDVNFVLIPEVPFELENGDKSLLKALENHLLRKHEERRPPHAVIVVAEGAGQHFFQSSSGGRDESGNSRYGDIGIYLKAKISEYFKDRFPVSIKYIEPSYLIRSVPANANDAIFCHFLAYNGVHAGMAGKTDMMIGYANGKFIHVPLEDAVKHRKHINPHGDLWRQVLLSTGQPW